MEYTRIKNRMKTIGLGEKCVSPTDVLLFRMVIIGFQNLYSITNDDEIINVFKGTVISEKHFGSCGSATPASRIYDEIQRRGLDPNYSLADWAVQYSDNEDLIMHEGNGWLYFKKRDYFNALPYLTKAAQYGFDDSQVLLAYTYYNGLVGEKDIREAMRWVMESINHGNNDARALFAQMIMNNDLQELLPDKVMRGLSYLELSKMKTN